MSAADIALSQLGKEVYCLREIIRIYLSVREDVGETGEESMKDLLREYAEKVMAEMDHG